MERDWELSQEQDVFTPEIEPEEEDDGFVEQDEGERTATTEAPANKTNIILLGAMGSGKSTVGWLLARVIGYGFIDLDQAIERRERKKVARIFADSGEEHFRKLERNELARLRSLRSHVLSVGGATVMDDENWRLLNEMGTTVWLNTPAAEIARRFNANDAELKKRPLLSEIAETKDKDQRLELLKERIATLIGQRGSRYGEATLAIADNFSTPDSTAHLIKDMLIGEGILSLPADHRPYDRWGIL